MTERVIVTGGELTKTLVTVYDEQGFVTEWPSLNMGRYGHGCGHFVNDDGQLVSQTLLIRFYVQRFQAYLVTGGREDAVATSTTELLVEGEPVWTVLPGSGDLPIGAAVGLRTVSVNNELIACGGHSVATANTIVKFDPSTLQWLQVDTMKQPRSNHGMSVVNVADIIEYCV